MNGDVTEPVGATHSRFSSGRPWSRSDLAVTGRILRQADVAHGVHESAQVDRRSGAQFGLHLVPRILGGIVAVHLRCIERLASAGIEPALLYGKTDEVRGAEKVVAVAEVERHLMDVAGIGDTHVVRSESLGDPEALAARILDQYPAFVLVGEHVRVAAVGGIAVPVDQRTDDLDRLARGAGALHRDARQVAVLRSCLRLRRPPTQFLARRRPYVAARDIALVQAAIGQRRRETPVFRVVHRQVTKGVRNLRDRAHASRHERFLGDTNGHDGVTGMVLRGHDLEPVTRHLVARAADEDAAVARQVLADVDGVAGEGVAAEQREDQ
jgi:hypothetical protein